MNDKQRDCRIGQDSSLFVDDAVYSTMWGYLPLDPLAASARQIQPGGAPPLTPMLPRPDLAPKLKEGIMDSGRGSKAGEL